MERKTSYGIDDFSTAFARSRFEELSADPDFDLGLLEKFSDTTAQQTLREIYTRVAQYGDALFEETVDMGLGRTITAEERTKLLHTLNERQYLDTLYIFENVFESASSPEAIVKIINNQASQPPERPLKILLALYPAEATYIRTEKAYPAIRQDQDLYDAIMESAEIMLSETSTIEEDNGDTYEYHAIEPYLGPRIPPLSSEMVEHMLNLWLEQDIAMEEYASLEGSSPQKPPPGLDKKYH